MTRSRVHVAVLAGDGIGPEVVDATLAVLDALDRRHDLGLGFTQHRAGALAYRDTGTGMSEDTFAACAAADAILLGAMGWPGIRYPDGTEISPQIELRQRLDLYAGLRPIRSIASRKRCRSSALRIEETDAPRSSTSYSSKVPLS